MRLICLCRKKRWALPLLLQVMEVPPDSEQRHGLLASLVSCQRDLSLLLPVQCMLVPALLVASCPWGHGSSRVAVPPWFQRHYLPARPGSCDGRGLLWLEAMRCVVNRARHKVNITRVTAPRSRKALPTDESQVVRGVLWQARHRQGWPGAFDYFFRWKLTTRLSERKATTEVQLDRRRVDSRDYYGQARRPPTVAPCQF
ncbi:hypothetical protein B0G38_001064 [Arthrobacter sp. VKM Ac-2550]|nr:hypothetical protein [Arthrobacter sp. VKM Ac-2550]